MKSCWKSLTNVNNLTCISCQKGLMRWAHSLPRGTPTWRHVSRAPGPENTKLCPELHFDLNSMNMKSDFTTRFPNTRIKLPKVHKITPSLVFTSIKEQIRIPNARLFKNNSTHVMTWFRAN